MDETKGDYRSINKVPTLLGVERKACILAVILTLMYHQITKQFLVSLLMFAVFWTVAYYLTKWEPRLFKMLPDLWRQRAVYCPRKYQP